MNLTELQILFQQKIQDTNPIFEVEQRPDTFAIANYLNKAVDRYLEKKYLSLATYEQRLVAIDANIDELHNLIVPDGILSAVKDLSEYNWSTRGHRYRVPEDVLIPISLACTITRTEVYVMCNQQVFAEWMSRLQAQRLVSHSVDKVMYPKPVVVWEDPYYLMLIGDAYTTVLTAGNLTYLRKPYKLDFDYSELAGVGTANLDITSLATGSYFLAKANLTYVNSAGVPTRFKPGDKVIKVAGYNDITYLDEPIVIGKPWGSTDTPDFPAFLHETLLDLAVSLFLDEAKFKLVPKSA
jgi:hypothetical protein